MWSTSIFSTGSYSKGGATMVHKQEERVTGFELTDENREVIEENFDLTIGEEYDDGSFDLEGEMSMMEEFRKYRADPENYQYPEDDDDDDDDEDEDEDDDDE